MAFGAVVSPKKVAASSRRCAKPHAQTKKTAPRGRRHVTRHNRPDGGRSRGGGIPPSHRHDIALHRAFLWTDPSPDVFETLVLFVATSIPHPVTAPPGHWFQRLQKARQLEFVRVAGMGFRRTNARREATR